VPPRTYTARINQRSSSSDQSLEDSNRPPCPLWMLKKNHILALAGCFLAA
jgi:hypothetical protein